jgi:large repetitive protein
VTIRGASQPGHATVFDRGNANTGAYVFDLQGADDVRIEYLTM